jgi:hypothetical protein
MEQPREAKKMGREYAFEIVIRMCRLLQTDDPKRTRFGADPYDRKGPVPTIFMPFL